MAQICRTCLQETATSDVHEITYDDISSQIKIEILLCIPEIDLGLLSNPIICKTCVEALNASYKFKKRCLYTEERIRSYLNSTKNSTGVKIIDVYRSNSFLDLLWSTKNIPTFVPKRNYLDDLNDLLDDALCKKEVEDDASTEDTIPIFPSEASKETIPNEPQTQPNTSTYEQEPTDSVSTKKQPDKIKQLSCKLCSFRTNFKQSLQTHSELHQIREPLTCTRCKFKTLNKGELHKHLLISHPDQKATATIKEKTPPKKNGTYSCNICEYTCSVPDSLKNHLIKIHKRKMLLCRICKIALGTEPQFKKHMKSHECKFKCTICTYQTNNRFGFAGHKRKCTASQ